MKKLTPQILAMYLGGWAELRPITSNALDGKYLISGEVVHLYGAKEVHAVPILRKLEDMTEEEEREVFGAEVKSAPLTLLPHEFTMLLSKSFDLFNGIEEGWAIDAKTLK